MALCRDRLRLPWEIFQSTAALVWRTNATVDGSRDVVAPARKSIDGILVSAGATSKARRLGQRVAAGPGAARPVDLRYLRRFDHVEVAT